MKLLDANQSQPEVEVLVEAGLWRRCWDEETPARVDPFTPVGAVPAQPVVMLLWEWEGLS